MSAVPMDQLVSGVVYRVEFDDCCIQGHTVDTFVTLKRDGDDDIEGAVFGRSYFTPAWGSFTFTQVDGEAVA